MDDRDYPGGVVGVSEDAEVTERIEIQRPCDCDSGYCNHLPNPFIGYICRQDTIEMADELNKAIQRIAELEREIAGMMPK